MKSSRSSVTRLRRCIGVFVAAICLQADPGVDAKIHPGLMVRLAQDEDIKVPFFVVFGDRPDLTPARGIVNRQARAQFVSQALQTTANRSQAGVRGYLQGQKVTYTAFWIENKIYIREGTLDLARALSQRPEVVAIQPEEVFSVPPQQNSGSIQSAEWNISKIRADQVWPTAKGAGVVVANIDTGVQYNHPALVNQYRGNTGSGFNHSGNWFDPTGLCGATPCDNNNHGTHTMGTMVGDDGAGNQIGIAPGAKWIACKGCESGSCSGSFLISCAQWIVSPGGGGPPNVVNNSWSGGGGNTWYQTYVQNWVAAGIFPAFAAANSGPGCNTVGSPGDYSQSFASGATDSSDAIAGFSSRGPSAFGVIKPDVSAPGVNIRSSITGSAYANFSGTSMASPHSAGTAALIFSAAPGYAGNVNGVMQLIRDTAVPFSTSETCGGLSAGAIPNNTYGRGRIDAMAAVTKALNTTLPNQPPVVLISSPGNGSSFNCPVVVSFTGSANDPEQGSLAATIAWKDNGTGFGTGASVSKSYACTDAGNHNIVASATDSGALTDTDTVTISIVNPNIPAAPSNLSATATAGKVTLTWKDNSSNETGFKIQRKPKTGGGAWGPVTTVGASVVTYMDTIGKGFWSYRVIATNASADSAPSNVVSIKVN